MNSIIYWLHIPKMWLYPTYLAWHRQWTRISDDMEWIWRERTTSKMPQLIKTPKWKHISDEVDDFGEHRTMDFERLLTNRSFRALSPSLFSLLLGSLANHIICLIRLFLFKVDYWRVRFYLLMNSKFCDWPKYWPFHRFLFGFVLFLFNGIVIYSTKSAGRIRPDSFKIAAQLCDDAKHRTQWWYHIHLFSASDWRYETVFGSQWTFWAYIFFFSNDSWNTFKYIQIQANSIWQIYDARLNFWSNDDTEKCHRKMSEKCLKNVEAQLLMDRKMNRAEKKSPRLTIIQLNWLMNLSP